MATVKKIMKVLLADDHAVVRDGMKHVIRGFNQDSVILEAENHTQALVLVDKHSDIDVLLLDLSMPGMDGLDGLRELHERLPGMIIVVLSATENSATVRKALQCGAKGYIPKSSTSEVLISALQLVFSGGIYLPPSLLEPENTPISAQITPKDGTNSETGKPGNDAPRLTKRQRQILVLLGQGKTNKEIARVINISDATVKAHASLIFKTLCVSNRTQAVHVAAKLGLLGNEGDED